MPRLAGLGRSRLAAPRPARTNRRQMPAPSRASWCD